MIEAGKEVKQELRNNVYLKSMQFLDSPKNILKLCEKKEEKLMS